MKRGAIIRSLALGAAVFIAYYVGARIGFALTFTPHPVSTLWPPNAILLAALLLFPKRDWWTILSSAFVSHLAIELGSGVPLLMVLCWFVSNCAQALMAATCVIRFARGPAWFDDFRDTGVFLLYGVLAAPFVASFLDAGFVKWVGWGSSSYWQVWQIRFFSNLVATLTFVPALVLGVRWLQSGGQIPVRRAMEAVMMVLTVVGLGVLVFDGRVLLPSQIPVLVCAPLPALLWAAVRFGVAGVSVALLITTWFATWGAIHGRGPFTQLSAFENVFSLQLFLIVVSVPLLLLASLLREREVARDSLVASHDQVQRLAGRLIHAQEEERQRIARELHDDFAQRLAVQAIGLSNVRRSLPPDCAEVAQKIDGLREGTVKLSEDLRLISRDLHPPALENAGLKAAVDALADEFTRLTNIRVHFHTHGDHLAIPFPVAVCCYRVLQECLQNVARHSGARSVEVGVFETDGRLFLIIADDGKGIEVPNGAAGLGIGIMNMRERVRLVSGEFSISNRAPRGTLVSVSVPLRLPGSGNGHPRQESAGI